MDQLQFNLHEACRRDFVLPERVLCIGTSNVEVIRLRKVGVVNRFLNAYHYLHSGDVFKGIGPITRAYGLFLGGELAGIVVYNPPGSPATGEFLFGKSAKNAMLKQGTLALSRLCVHPDAPFNTTGYLITESLRLLWEDNQERINKFSAPFRTVISFADTILHHSGTVYRSQNAWFAGIYRGHSLGGFFHPETGHVIHVRQGGKTLTKKDCPSGYLPFTASAKLRYLFFLGDKRNKLNTMRQLNENVKFQCKVDNFSVYKEGRMVKLSDTRSYEDVYNIFGNAGPNKDNRRYADYLSPTA